MTANQARKRVLITGAAGRIGSSLADHLKDRYDLRLHYHRTVPDAPPVADHMRADVSVFEEVAPLMHGIDAVVHMAGEPSTRASWESVRARNIDGTYNVLEAARQAGVKKVIFASTNHVMGMYDRDGQWPIYADQPVRPDSLYGVSKAYGEALGRMYMERHGLRVFCLRIGAVRANDDPAAPTANPLIDLDAEGRRNRLRAVWLSRRDCAELIARCLDVDDVSWAVVYGVSDNPRRFWDLNRARELLGWEPLDAAPA